MYYILDWYMVVLKLNVTGKKQNKTNKCGNKDDGKIMKLSSYFSKHYWFSILNVSVIW